MTGQAGGWPLTVFLTPDQIPIFTGTYFPKERRYGMPAFREVLTAIDGYYRGKGDEIRQRGASLVEALGSMQTASADDFAALSRAPLVAARERVSNRLTTPSTAVSAAGRSSRIRRRSSSCSHTGTRTEPMARTAKRWRWSRSTLDCMAQRGLYDHLGGGFFRYSVDRFWSIPHFEKMLYDNAQLLSSVRRRLRGDGHAAVCERRGRHGRLGHARHAGRTRRLLFDARRRLRARGRQVLRLDARGVRRRARARRESALAKRVFGLAQPANFEGKHWHLYLAEAPEAAAAALGIEPGRAPRAARERTPQLARRSRAACLAGTRREAARLVERPHDRRHGARRARARPSQARRVGDARRRFHPGRALAGRPPQSHLQGRPRALHGLSRRLRVPRARVARALAMPLAR